MIQLHYCISGFTQTAGRNSGVLKLSELLHAEGYSRGLDARVFLHPWKADWATIAEHAWLLSQVYRRDVVAGIYGYSWGAGHGAIRLAAELAERGIRVRSMVLCDPVPRPWLPIRWAALLPANWGRSIKVPANVAEVWPLHQTMNLPQGHRVVARSAETVVHPSREIWVTHQYADDAEPFHTDARHAAALVSAETRS